MAAPTRRFPGLRDLAGRPPFRRLIAAQTLSQAADGLYQISLASVLIFSVEAARTPAQVTKILAVTTLPFSIVGPFTGPFIDRFSRRSVLVGSKLAMVAITIGMLGGEGTPEGVLLALAVANVSINRFFHATKSAVLPSLVPADRYLIANAVSTTTGMITSLLGAVVGGIVVDATSPTVGVAAAAVAMALSAALAATLPLPPGERRGLAGIVSELRDNLRDVHAGLRALRQSSQAKYGVISIWLIRALLGFVVLAALVLLRERFDIKASGFSTVFVALGIGGFFAAAADDPLLSPGAMLAAELAAEHELVYLTGRPAHLRSVTRRWLESYDLPPGRLLMRGARDFRPARVVKLEALRALGREQTVELVVDDDPDVVATLRAAGFAVVLADWAVRSVPLHEGQEREGRT